MAICASATAGTPLLALVAATLEAGKGLVGDRYHSGIGTFSAKLLGKPDAAITPIESEEIDRFNRAESLCLAAGAFRRNLVTCGVRLNELVGLRFAVATAALEGIRLCEPCAHLAEIVSPKVLAALTHRVGLRARIIWDATVRTGDQIETAFTPDRWLHRAASRAAALISAARRCLSVRRECCAPGRN